MDDQPAPVSILVSRIDTTSPMRLCLDLSSDLRQAGFDVRILEIKTMLREQGLRALLGVLARASDRGVVLSCGAVSDICAGIIRLHGGSARRSFVSYLHCHQWQDLRHERGLLWATVYFFLWRWSLYLKDHIACVSYDIANELPARLAAKATVLYNHVESKSAAPLEPQDDVSAATQWVGEQHRLGRKVLLGFGLFLRRKNFQTLIAAIAGLADVSLLLVGKGHEEESLRHRSRQLNCDDRVLIHRFVRQPVRLCDVADAYVSCSLSEGFGLANLEAASSGIEVILPSHAVNLEVLSGLPNVRFYNPRSQTQLIDEIAQVAREPNRRRVPIPNRFSRSDFSGHWLRFMSAICRGDDRRAR